jgi:hypothetical protein
MLLALMSLSVEALVQMEVTDSPDRRLVEVQKQRRTISSTHQEEPVEQVALL